MHRILFIAALVVSAALVGCGGSSGNDNPPVSNAAPVRPTSAPVVPASTIAPASPVTPASPETAASATAPASDSTGAEANPPSVDPITVQPDNTTAIVVDSAMGTVVNMPYVSVTICVPGAQGASRCATVDHMLLDTGSPGVRVTASALDAALAAQLPAQTGASNDATSRAPLAQCTIFASGYTWGSIRRADVGIGGKKASDIPIQLIGDSTYPDVPADCASHGGAGMNTAAALGANGIVGIGHLARDFPQAAQTPLVATYYYCPTPSSCAAASVPLDRQTMNPVAAFTADNNGTIIRLPALPPTGQQTVAGELVFGIGTQSNNALPETPTFIAVSDRGAFTTTYNRRATTSVIDSGSNGFFFQDPGIAVLASGWYAPAVTLTLTATMLSNFGNVQSIVPFSIANALTLFATRYAAHDNLGAPTSSLFTWGLPFFYGRDIYTALSGASAGPQTGPYVAF